MSTLKTFVSKVRRQDWVLLLIALVILPIYHLVVNLGYQSKSLDKDAILAVADQNLIGGLLFVFLPTQFNALWISNLVYYAYISLAAVFAVLVVWLFLLKKAQLLRVVVASVVFSLMFSLPLFYLMPCQGPSLAFIENSQNVSVPASVTQEMGGYYPSEFVKNKITDISKNQTSCFPSMQAVLALIAIYFFARIDRRTIFLSIPWLTLNLAGGLYYAQHYLVDYIVAIPVAMLGIASAYLLFRSKKVEVE